MILNLNVYCGEHHFNFLPAGSTKFEFLTSKLACRIVDENDLEPWFLFLRFAAKSDFIHFKDDHLKKYNALIKLFSNKAQYGKKTYWNKQQLLIPHKLFRFYNCSYYQ